MKKKKLTLFSACPRCPDEEENINHLLFLCLYARLTWALSPVSHLFFPSGALSLYENFSRLLILEHKDSREMKERLKPWPWILWHIWTSRNDYIFSDIDKTANVLLEEAWMECNEWNQVEHISTSPHVIPAHTTSVSRRKAPPACMLKCNVDGSRDEKTGRCGVAWILRDNTGAIKHYGAKRYPLLLSALETEASALSWAAFCVSQLGYTNIIFESDCTNIIKAMHQPEQWPRLHNFTSEISDRSKGKDFFFSFASRDSNRCADAIAKCISETPIYHAFIDVLPTT